MSRQFTLKLSRTRRPSFVNFIEKGNDKALVATQRLVTEPVANAIYLWGKACGKTHLLLAATNAAAEAGLQAIYLSMRDQASLDTRMLADLEEYDLVCIDDIERIARDAAWEEALFHLYNRVRERDGRLLIASDCSLAQLPVELPDLHSRLAWGASYQLLPLDDEGKRQLLLQIADEKGMAMNGDAADYLLRRYSRDVHELVALMEKLDRRSLAAKQKLTIPFLRQSLSMISDAG
ncbi:MAG: DnaA regulatory inactivator Hda [Gammaproteobacteria bacterium]|jgi:DnaA-homolog protein